VSDPYPRTSVIIPTYNRSAYLRQAVDSVFAQRRQDFEILVVDDGSTDDTAQVVASMADPRLRYLPQANAGRSAARNRGLAEARGEYIAFLDDDDLYLPDKLAVQTAYLDDHPEAGLAAGGALMIAADGTCLRTWQPWRGQPELSLPRCLYACPLLTCSVLLRRPWLTALDHWFDAEMDRAEDTDFWIRLLVAGCSMAWIPQVVCAYRQHTASSQGDGGRYQRGFLRLLDKLYARADLPAAVQAERSVLYAHYYVVGACHAYATGQISAGQEGLQQAVAAAPQSLAGKPPPVVSSIVGAALGDGVDDPVVLIDRVFRQLPPALASLRPYRRYALSALPMQRVFAAHAAHEQVRLTDWLLGVLRYPGWLANRGVWSILVCDLVLRGAISGARS
jgi:GT2 family glycosyltransferase